LCPAAWSTLSHAACSPYSPCGSRSQPSQCLPTSQAHVRTECRFKFAAAAGSPMRPRVVAWLCAHCKIVQRRTTCVYAPSASMKRKLGSSNAASEWSNSPSKVMTTHVSIAGRDGQPARRSVAIDTRYDTSTPVYCVLARRPGGQRPRYCGMVHAALFISPNCSCGTACIFECS
jgi:hypothetical protein